MAIIDSVDPCDAPARISKLLPELLATPDLLPDAFRAVPAGDYEKREIFICPNGRFSLLAVAWPAGITLPIHDHATWCAFGVYEGVIQETRFAPAGAGATGAEAVVTSCDSLGVGCVSHLPVGSADIHAIHNPTAATAISFHVYGGDSRQIGPNVKTVYSLQR